MIAAADPVVIDPNPALGMFSVLGWTAAAAMAAWHWRNPLMRVLGWGLDLTLDAADFVAGLTNPETDDEIVDDLLAPDEVTWSYRPPDDWTPPTAEEIAGGAPLGRLLMQVPGTTYGGVLTTPLGCTPEPAPLPRPTAFLAPPPQVVLNPGERIIRL